MGVRALFDGDLLTLELEGIYEQREIIEGFTRAVLDPAFPRNFRFLVDVRHSQSLQFRSLDEVRAIVDNLGPFADRIGHRCAVVVETGVQYGLSRMGCIYCEDVSIEAQVFNDFDEAVAWLHRDAPDNTGQRADNGDAARKQG